MTSHRRQRLHPDFYSAPGATALLTMCCSNNCRIFDDTIACDIAISHIHQLHGTEWSVLAYVVMPDHVHSMVVNLSASLVDFVRLYKGRTAAELRRRLDLSMIWQKSFYDRMIGQHEDLGKIIQYVFENPVRAGYVESWTKWRGAGSCMWPDIGKSAEEFGFENIRWQEAFLDV